MLKFQQLAKDAQSNGDPILVQNYLQHADHYLRRYNELSEKQMDRPKAPEKEIIERSVEKKSSEFRKTYLSSDNFKSILILFNSNSFLHPLLKFFLREALIFEN